MLGIKEGRTFIVEPGGSFAAKSGAEMRVPGDKSVSHRAVMFGAIAEGVTEVLGFLDGEDCLATAEAFAAMGVRIDRLSATHLQVHGVGLNGLRAPTGKLDLGNSGTSMRLMSGLLAGQNFSTTLIGDASLSRRPMRRIVEPLLSMGARIATTEKGTAPLLIEPAPAGLHGIQHRSKVASAQVKSGLLLAGLYAQGETEILEPEASRDHTERMFQAMGIRIQASPGRAAIHGPQQPRAVRVQVPADISSAAFPMVAAAISRGSDLLLNDVGVNPTRTGVIDILRRMGTQIDLINERVVSGEPIADIRVRHRPLQGIEIDRELVTLAIDEIPSIFIAAASASGRTTISGAEELRVKESDRLQAMCDGLLRLGISARAKPDGAIIDGGRIGGGSVDSHGDHRIAMSFAVAGLKAHTPITVRDCENVDTSFPGFVRLMREQGLRIESLEPGMDG